MEKIKLAIGSKTVRQSAITSTATLLNGSLGILFYIYIARVLGPANFGIFSVAILTLTLLSDIASVGTDTGIVRFVGKHIRGDSARAFKFLKLGLEVKLVVGLSLVIVGWVVMPLVANQILHKPELTFPLRLSLVGALGALVLSFATSSLQALQKFWVWGGLNVSLNALRLGTIIAFSLLGILGINNSIIIYLAFPYIGFIVGLFLLPNFLVAKNETSVAREFFHYNKWVALFTVIAAFSSRLDTYISTSLLSLVQVGIYSVAVQLVGVLTQVAASLATVFAPKFASFDSDIKAIEYIKKTLVLTTAIAVASLVIGIPLSYILLPFIYGQGFAPAVYPFIILLLAQAIFLVSLPFHGAVFYYFSYPKLFVFISVVYLIVMGAGGWILISNFGYIGAAFTFLLGNISNFIIPAVWVLKKFKKV